MTTPVIPGTNVALDPVHNDFDFMSGQMTQDIWADKYKYGDERHFNDTAKRVSTAVFANDLGSAEGVKAMQLTYEFMTRGLLMPAGRILAGAGTDKWVTLLNCFVNGDMQDSMKSITEHCSYMVLTMQMGGGMGTPFENVRPFGARLKRTGEGSKASGPIPFLEAFDAWGKTVRSAGDRRGAQMWTISDTHPDLMKYVHAKNTKDYLTQGNMSINISDAFMEAKDADEDWALHFPIEPAFDRPQALIDLDFEEELPDGTTRKQFVYSIHKARDIWEEITRNTYEYSEPGILFMDRVNELNNLHYVETIRCTNPCGEQPLPPHNACDLGHVVLARMVRNPFTEDAAFDFELLRAVVRVLQRFLDNIWDITKFPLEQQREECLSKRRTGLGYTGLADVFAQMGYRYGSARSADLAERIQQTICEEAYNTSIDLAIEKGAFPLFDADQYLAPNTFAGSRLPRDIQDRIRKHGIRNGVLLTIAPTGTTSIVYGNPQGGLEPFFALLQKRKVKQEDDSFKEYIDGPYACRLYHSMFQGKNEDEIVELPPFFNSVMAGTVKVEDHILIQSRVQRWVDASISKTTNIPKEMPYEDFVKVYDLAYTAGCKGCTTYRPSDVRGSILEDASVPAGTSQPEQPANIDVVPDRLVERPIVLEGATYKLKWPRRTSAMYLTINSDVDGVPFEVFITGKDGAQSEWTMALALMITALYRKRGDISFVTEELKSIQSTNDGAFIKMPHWTKPQYISSLPAYLGHMIEYHFMRQTDKELDPTTPIHQHIVQNLQLDRVDDLGGEPCPQCKHPTSLVRSEGCDTCLNQCGYSHCG